jgi:hypothetical protein
MPIKLERGNIPKPETTDEFEAFEGFVHGVDKILDNYKNEPKEVKEALIFRHHFQSVNKETQKMEKDKISE